MRSAECLGRLPLAQLLLAVKCELLYHAVRFRVMYSLARIRSLQQNCQEIGGQ